MPAPTLTTIAHLDAPLKNAASGTDQNAVVSTAPLILHEQGSMDVYKPVFENIAFY
jgi:hypothetical protein